MKLDERILRLIAIGASIAANCQPCLQTNVTKVLECGADEQEIAEAIEVGKRVRRGAATKMDEFVISLNHPAPASGGVETARCDCS